MSVLLLGSVALDSITTPSDHVRGVLGGSASYAAYAMHFFGKPHLLTVVGEDFRDSYLPFFQQKGFDLQGMQILPGETFYWEACYQDNFSKRITHCTKLNVFEGFQPEVPPSYRELSYVFLANISPELQLQVLEKVNNPGFSMVDTMPLWIDTQRDKVLEVFSKVDAVIINDEEARMLFGALNLKKAALRILDLGPSWVILKKGEHGAFLMNRKGKIFLLPAYPIDSVVDPTGAGDSFAGALIGYLSSQNKVDFSTMKRAMVWGTVTASFAIEDFSIHSLQTIGLKELEMRYKEFCSYLTVE